MIYNYHWQKELDFQLIFEKLINYIHQQLLNKNFCLIATNNAFWQIITISKNNNNKLIAYLIFLS